MEQTCLTHQQIMAELFRSPHGHLLDYQPLVHQAILADPAFVAHGMAWARRHATVRDVQVALPVLTLAHPDYPGDLIEHSLAHLALLNPLQLVAMPKGRRSSAWRFAEDVKMPRYRYHLLQAMGKRYIRAREDCWPWWERTALNYRGAFRALYALTKCKPSEQAKAILFDRRYPEGGLFANIKAAHEWDSERLAGFLRAEHIPFLVAQGIVGARIREPAVLSAIVDGMTAAQLTKHMKALKSWGFKGTAATRGAVTQALTRAATRGRKDTALLAAKAAEVLEEEAPELAVELEALQEAQIEQQAGIDGNWLILGDISGSMTTAIEPCRLLAAYLARHVKGQVLLGWFNTDVYFMDVTGKSYAAIKAMTQQVRPNGGTAIGAGLAGALDRGFQANGIAIVSDGGENTRPLFLDVYRRYVAQVGFEPPVYLWRVPGQDTDLLTLRCEVEGIPFRRFPVGASIDEYGIGTLAATMRTKIYSLVDEVMNTPLLTLDQALRPPKQWRTRA